MKYHFKHMDKLKIKKRYSLNIIKKNKTTINTLRKQKKIFSFFLINSITYKNPPTLKTILYLRNSTIKDVFNYKSTKLN